jgi:hypothetical protein
VTHAEERGKSRGEKGKKERIPGKKKDLISFSHTKTPHSTKRYVG